MADLVAPKIMGILNVTPDSFSDGGRYLAPSSAIEQALSMVEHGADIIDIGGESTRPGAQAVTAEEEMRRVLPVIKSLRSQSTITISIDTSKASVMRAAVEAGADMINDVAALRTRGALDAAAELAVPVCLMHMQGEPPTMQQSPSYARGVMKEVKLFLRGRIAAALSAGIEKRQLIIDPGFGFGKTQQHNLQLLAGLAELKELACPILVGLSRKSMFGKLLNVGIEERLVASLTAATMAVMRGANILRVHDVRQTAQALAVISACENVEQSL